MKKAPVVLIVLATVLLFSIFGGIGSASIYAGEPQDYRTTPFLSRVFTGINSGIYPWDLFNKAKREEGIALAKEREEKEAYLKAKQGEATEATTELTETVESKTEPGPVETEPIPTPSPTAKPTPTATPEPTPTPTPAYTPRYEPLRESSYDEYLGHISADIYGSAGVEFASTYDFKKVDLSYFDDALFIGDSRTVGLRNYTDMSEHADFLCETSLTIWKVFKSDFKGAGTVEKLLAKNDYGKIYIMVGVNELGTGTTEDYMKEYTYVVDRLHELEPDAKIIIEAIMHVDKEKSDSDKIFNNSNILGRNNAIATLADNVTFFYIDCNSALCDEEGFLRDDLRGDHLHLKGASNELWKQFLMENGV